MSVSTILTSKRTIFAIVCSLSLATMAATPVALWDGDFSTLEKNGWTMDLMGNALSADNSTITIDRDNNGVRIDAATPVNGVTVVVRYSGLATGSNGKVLATSSVNADYDRTGIRLTTSGTLCGCANNNTDSGTMSNYGSAAGSAPASGYMAFVYKGDTTNGDYGTFIYFKTVSGTYPSNSSWGTYQCSYSADTAISGVTLGGLRQPVSGWTAAKGMTITGVAVFEGRVSAAELNAYSFPATDHAVTDDTTVSALNTVLGSVAEVNLNVSPDVTITFDEAFAAQTVHFASEGNVRFDAKAPPSASELAKFDMNGVQGAVIRSWYTPGAIGFNFHSYYGTNTEKALVPGGVWGSNYDSTSGSASVVLEDGLPASFVWSAGGKWAWSNSDFMGGYLDDGSNNGNGAEVYVAQLPFEAYDVIIYAATDSNSGQFIAKTVNGKTYTWDGSKTVEGDSAWGSSRNEAVAYGVNALRVNNLSGPLTIFGGARSGQSSIRGGIAAIQVVPTGADSGDAEILIDATEGWTTTDSDILGSIRTTYRNVRVLGSGQYGATLEFGDLSDASTYISSHIVFEGGTHAVTIDGSSDSTIGANASAPILEVLGGTTLDFYQHDLSGWLGSAAAKAPSCNIQVDDGGQLNIRLDGAGTTYYQGRYTICPGATVASYVTTSGDGNSHLRFNGGAIEGAEQIYVPASPSENPGTAVINGVEGNAGVFLASDATAGLGVYVGENSTLDFNLDIAGVAEAPLGKWGSGTLNLTGDMSSYAGTLTVNEGTVNVGSQTVLANVVNNATLTFGYGTTISSYSGAGTVTVDVSSLVIDGAVASGSYVLLPGADVDPDNVEVVGLPEESGFSVHIAEDGIVLTDVAFTTDWTGPSDSWTENMFDGRAGSTDGKSVYFANSLGNDEVTVTVDGAKSVSSIAFLANDTSYTIAPNNGPSADKVTSTGALTVSGLAPVRVETPLEVAGISLAAGTEFTYANTALTIPDGALTGSGTFILDPGEGKTNIMSSANTSFTGEAVIASGTVKMGDANSFGTIPPTSSIRVKSGAILDANGVTSTYYAEGKTKNHAVLEEGAVFTSSVVTKNGGGNEDMQFAGFSALTLLGDATVDTPTVNVPIALRYHWDYVKISLNEYTLVKTGEKDFFISTPNITGTGVFDVREGTVTLCNDYSDYSPSKFPEGTLKLAAGTTLRIQSYNNTRARFTVKNLEVNGSVQRDNEASTLTVTGYITGNGTTPMLTLAEGAVLKPTGTGYLTITDSLGLNGVLTNDVSGINFDTVSVVPLFKVGSPEMLPDAENMAFSCGELPKRWSLEKTSDGLGYKLKKEMSFTIRLR